MIIRGNTVGTTAPRPNYAETDPEHSTFIRNKPEEAIARAQKTADEALAIGEAALLRAGGTMTGALDMGGQKLTGLAAPTATTQAVPLGYLETFAAHRCFHTTAVLKSDSWMDDLQTVSVAGITQDPALTDILAGPAAGEGHFEAWHDAAVRLQAQGENALTFRCDVSPAADITVNLLILRHDSLPASTEAQMLSLQEDTQGCSVLADVEGEVYGVSNLTVNQGATEQTYDFTVL